MYEEFDTLGDAENRARVIYPNKSFFPVLGSAWMANGYISIQNGKYRLQTDL